MAEAEARGPQVHWPIVRLLVDFLLDAADIARKGGSVLDTLILTVVIEANVASLSQDPALQRKYGALGSPPPDDLRRPVSMSGVAASLGLPFETVRRHLNRLAAAGECVIGPKGVVVPTARLASPDYVQLGVAQYERTRALYRDIKALGILDSVAPPGAADADPPLASDAPPVRICTRLLSEYYLRVIELLMRRVGDPVSGLIVVGLARANMSGFTPEQRAAGHILPEAVRKPVRRTALAEQLGLPAETVRRRLIDLEQRGYCHTTAGGVSFAPEAMLNPDAMLMFEENQRNFLRFVNRLRRCGLLDLWDAELRAA